MTKYFEKNLWLFKLFISLPICFHLLLWQLSSVERADVPASIPDWFLKIIPGIGWGLSGSIVNCSIAILLFTLNDKLSMRRNKMQPNFLERYAGLYFICWLIAFCFMNFVWLNVSGFADSHYLSILPFVFFNIMGNVVGLFSFIIFSTPVEVRRILKQKEMMEHNESTKNC